jgi:hypothetical protein
LRFQVFLQIRSVDVHTDASCPILRKTPIVQIKRLVIRYALSVHVKLRRGCRILPLSCMHKLVSCDCALISHIFQRHIDSHLHDAAPPLPDPLAGAGAAAATAADATHVLFCLSKHGSHSTLKWVYTRICCRHRYYRPAT